MVDLRMAITGDPAPISMGCPQTVEDWFVCALANDVSIAEIAPDSCWKQTLPKAEAKLELTATEVTLAGEGSIKPVRRHITDNDCS